MSQKEVEVDDDDDDNVDLVQYAFSKIWMLCISSPLEVGSILQWVQYNPRSAQHVRREDKEDIKMVSLDDDYGQGADNDDDSSSSISEAFELDLTTRQSEATTPEPLGAVDSVGYLTRSSFNNDDPTRPPYELAGSDSNSFFGLLYELIGLEGLQALWKGIFTDWMNDCLSVLIQPTIEGALNDYFQVVDEGIPFIYLDNPWPTLATTIGSQVITGWLLSPFELAKTRLIVQTTNPYHRKYKGLFNCITTVFQEEGLTAFYGGVSLMPTILYNAIDPLFTTAHHFIIARVFGISIDKRPFTYAIYDLGLTTLGLMITIPLETARRRLWAQQMPIKQNVNGKDFVTCVRRSQIPYTSMWNCLYRICKEEGFAQVISKTEKRKRKRSQHSTSSFGSNIGEEIHISALYRGFSLKLALVAFTVLLSSLS